MSACHNELRHELWQIRVPATLKGTTVSTGRSVHRTDFLVNLGTCAPHCSGPQKNLDLALKHPDGERMFRLVISPDSVGLKR
jgi:hypothetical protein